jgi:hypothetical protein
MKGLPAPHVQLYLYHSLTGLYMGIILTTSLLRLQIWQGSQQHKLQSICAVLTFDPQLKKILAYFIKDRYQKYYKYFNFFMLIVFSYTGCDLCLSLSGPSWSWSYGSWVYNYLCNRFLSPLMLWIRIPHRARYYKDLKHDRDKLVGWFYGVLRHF